MIWRLRRQEPSFSSMNEKSFESRRVRTQPWTWIGAIGAALCSAALTEVVAGIGGSLLVNCGSTSSSVLFCSRFAVRRVDGKRRRSQGGGYRTEYDQLHLHHVRHAVRRD